MDARYPKNDASGRPGSDSESAAAVETAAHELESAVPRDVESDDHEAFEAVADRVLPAAEAAREAGVPADAALLAAARIAAHRALRGDAVGAVELLEPAAALASEAELRDPFLAAVLADQLASALQDAGRGDDAVAAANRAEAVARHVCRPGEPRLAAMLANVGTVYKRQGDFLTAEVHFRRALELLEDEAARGATSGGASDSGRLPLGPLIGPICLSLCDLLRARGDPLRARPFAERAVREAESWAGPMHQATADALESLALTLDEAGEETAARPLWRRVAALYELNLGEDHPLTRAAHGRAELPPRDPEPPGQEAR